MPNAPWINCEERSWSTRYQECPDSVNALAGPCSHIGMMLKYQQLEEKGTQQPSRLNAGSLILPMASRVRIFISSSSDLLREREVVERSIARLDGVWQKHVRVEGFRWERRHYEAIRTFQESIGEMSEYDVVLAMVWKRIGTPLPPDI